MITYLFNNKRKINKDTLLNQLISNYTLDVIDKNSKNIVLGNSDMLVDIDKKYINILLFNETVNIKPTTDYIMEQLYG